MRKKMIDRYINGVLEYLPLRDRWMAGKIISRMIYENLEYYTNGMKPTTSDVRAVLQEMGDPDELAYAYYAEFHKPLFKIPNLKKMLKWITKIFTALALILVTVGIVGLIFGTANMQCLVLGTVLGILVVLYQMAAPSDEGKYIVSDAHR
ncbi:MAG: hypothetical protein UHS54_10560 [Lachnospiraceae bacterium]|nr:hypothetical protein [Lachnospiraceae bacterium]